ncbi:hypothetical protein E2562_009812 [Oryza meyeriana var. granulata]|uniref:Uncharacterized protein n=1 Tax=Oryza meyeriana var. granulata TaxID=110450 RepID=A0A6G1BU08_9ORYZ|nr:hypothetical protein E2562_009812 [Oryza meyeriana var. granulata]
MEVNELLYMLSFHPGDYDIVFLGVPGAVAAYLIERGTMSIRTRCGVYMSFYEDMFPYAYSVASRRV